MWEYKARHLDQIIDLLVSITRAEVSSTHIYFQTHRSRFWRLAVTESGGKLGRFPILHARIVQAACFRVIEEEVVSRKLDKSSYIYITVHCTFCWFQPTRTC